MTERIGDTGEPCGTPMLRSQVFPSSPSNRNLILRLLKCQGPKDHTDLLRCKRQTHTVNDGSRGCRGVALESRTHTDLLERLAPTFDLRGTLVHTESRSVALSAKYLVPLRSG